MTNYLRMPEHAVKEAIAYEELMGQWVGDSVKFYSRWDSHPDWLLRYTKVGDGSMYMSTRSNSPGGVLWVEGTAERRNFLSVVVAASLLGVNTEHASVVRVGGELIDLYGGGLVVCTCSDKAFVHNGLKYTVYRYPNGWTIGYRTDDLAAHVSSVLARYFNEVGGRGCTSR